jgi:hypothetical protein
MIQDMKALLIPWLILLLLTACAPAIQPDVPAPGIVPTATEQTPLVLPAATDADSTPEAAPDCAGDDVRQMAVSIADDYPFSSGGEVMGWFCEGAEFEDILLALETEDLTGVPAEEMLEMLAEGLSWDEIWLVVGLTNE